MSFGAAKEGGGWWGLAWKPTLHNESLSLGSKLNIRKGEELLKPRSLCPGCKFAQESHFVASFMAIICILSPLMQFPFSPSGSPRETPNKITGQGPRSWEKDFRKNHRKWFGCEKLAQIFWFVASQNNIKYEITNSPFSSEVGILLCIGEEGNFETTTHKPTKWLTNVECRATSVANISQRIFSTVATAHR